MPIILDGTAGVTNNATDLNYTGTLTGGTGVVNLGSGQVFKDASGNVGIGTSSPSAKFQIVQDQAVNSYFDFYNAINGGGIVWRQIVRNLANTGTTSVDIAKVAGGAFLINNNDTHVSNYTAFGVGASERMRIDSSGNLLVGTTFAQNGSHTVDKNNNNGLAFTARNTGTTNGYVIDAVSASAGGTGFALYRGFSDTSTLRFLVFGNGNVVNGNNSYGALSDAKLKENVTDTTPKLSKLSQVRIVNYNLIGEDHKQLGVIAQEVEQIFPGMVDESPDRDNEGNDLGTTTKSVKYSVFVPMLIKAIQEQQAIIESLTARITALEAK